MPNHVTNIIEIKDLGGDNNLPDVVSKFTDSELSVDFNSITPKPKCLEGFEPHMGIVGAAKTILTLPVHDVDFIGRLEAENNIRNYMNYLGKGERPFSAKDRDDVHQGLNNYFECGHIYWHSWCNDNWGTEWGAYNQHEPKNEGTLFQFDTAWNHPLALIEKLSKSTPSTIFHVKWADEDLGSNCGHYEITNGEITNRKDATVCPGDNWIEFAFNICHQGEDPKEWGFDSKFNYAED